MQEPGIYSLLSPGQHGWELGCGCGCQNYGPVFAPIIIRHLIFRVPKRDHHFDNHPCRGYRAVDEIRFRWKVDSEFEGVGFGV